MKLSKQLTGIKKACYNTKSSTPVLMTPKLAEELLSLRPKDSRPLSEDHVWYWAFIYVSGITPEEAGFDKEWNTIHIDDKYNDLTDGAHRLAGFITSGIPGCGMNLEFGIPAFDNFIPDRALDLLCLNPINKRKITKKQLKAIEHKLRNPVVDPNSFEDYAALYKPDAINGYGNIKPHSPKRQRK
jgi:hypothetical protein